MVTASSSTDPKFQRRFSLKLVLVFCLIVVLSLIVNGFFLDRTLRRFFIDQLTAGLKTDAQIIASQLAPDFFKKSSSLAAEGKAIELSRVVAGRVTFIRPDGIVVGDSDVPSSVISKIENHLDRPEIKTALEGSAGHAIRHSHTINVDLLYVAVPFNDGGTIRGVVRLALPLTGIREKIARIHSIVVFISLAAMLVGILLVFRMSRTLSQPLTEMSSVAARLADGDYSARVVSVGDDEHGRLGETLNLLAARINATIEELSRDKSHLATVLENMTDAVVAIDEHEKITVINSAFSMLFDVESRISIGKPFLEIMRNNQLNQLLQRVLQTRKNTVEEVRTYGPDERIFEANAVPLSKNNQPAGALLVMHDVTQLRRLEQVRRDFVANVSHELRTPLAAVKGFAETLLTGGVDDKENRAVFLKSIEKHTDQMTELVEDLLDLTAIESGHRIPIKESVSLKGLIDDVLKSLQPLAARNKVALANRLGSDLPPLHCDTAQIRQVFTNLIDNAIKFNKEGGGVSVSARVVPGSIQISVEDSGIGIPHQDIPRVFERFYRVDKARSRAMGGTGLGLSIVKHIVEAHGGHVSIESSVGKGSLFLISLPF